jgi:hypothetical protein
MRIGFCGLLAIIALLLNIASALAVDDQDLQNAQKRETKALNDYFRALYGHKTTPKERAKLRKKIVDPARAASRNAYLEHGEEEVKEAKKKAKAEAQKSPTPLTAADIQALKKSTKAQKPEARPTPLRTIDPATVPKEVDFVKLPTPAH